MEIHDECRAARHSALPALHRRRLHVDSCTRSPPPPPQSCLFSMSFKLTRASSLIGLVNCKGDVNTGHQ